MVFLSVPDALDSGQLQLYEEILKIYRNPELPTSELGPCMDSFALLDHAGYIGGSILT
jgi:hypothetical protein